MSDVEGLQFVDRYHLLWFTPRRFLTPDPIAQSSIVIHELRYRNAHSMQSQEHIQARAGCNHYILSVGDNHED